jgi:hypothetical protein
MLNRILQVQILTFSRLKALTQEVNVAESMGYVVQPRHQNPPTHPPTHYLSIQLQLIWWNYGWKRFLSSPHSLWTHFERNELTPGSFTWRGLTQLTRPSQNIFALVQPVFFEVRWLAFVSLVGVSKSLGSRWGAQRKVELSFQLFTQTPLLQLLKQRACYWTSAWVYLT